MTLRASAAGPVASQADPKTLHSRWPRALLLLAIFAYALFFSILTLTRYAAFEARALDMGNLNQAIWNTAHGNWFHLTNQPGVVNRLSLHVEPIIIPISWLYRIYPAPEFLLVLQACVVALGALPTYLLARDRHESRWFGLLFAITFLLHPTIQAANWLEFHPLTLAPTFLIAAFYYLQAGRSARFALFALLAAACKEEIGLILFMMGLYAFWVFKMRRTALITMALSLAWALLAVFVIQNLFASGNIHWERYAYLGESSIDKVVALLTRPVLVLEQLRAAGALHYLVQITLPTAFLAWLAPAALLLAAPSLAINLLADFSPMHQVDTLIYAAPVAAVVIIAAVLGSARLHRWLHAMPWARSARWGAFGAALCLAAALLWSQRSMGYLPGGAHYRLFEVTDHHRLAATVLAQIPPGAAVSAQDRLVPHVSGRETLYIFPRVEDADTVLLDVTGPAWPLHPNDLYREVQKLRRAGFGVVSAVDGYLLLGRGKGEAEIPDAFYSAWQTDAVSQAQPALATFDGKLDLLDATIETDSFGELVVRLDWRPQLPLDEELRFYIGYRAPDGTPLHDSRFYPPVATLWYPTSQWHAGTNYRIRTLPWTLESERFTLVIGVYRGDDGWDNAGRLLITDHVGDLLPLEADTLLRVGAVERSPQGIWRVASDMPPAPERAFDAQFGRVARLQGATLSGLSATPGGAIEFTLFWDVRSTPEVDYSLFAHLINSNGEKIAQADWQPRDTLGPRPTSTWRAGELIVDRQTLLIPTDAALGEYRLLLGAYDWRSGERLHVTGADAGPEDVVQLAGVGVKAQ